MCRALFPSKVVLDSGSALFGCEAVALYQLLLMLSESAISPDAFCTLSAEAIPVVAIAKPTGCSVERALIAEGVEAVPAIAESNPCRFRHDLFPVAPVAGYC